ncbi:MAG: c-type cytochrome [Rhodocyclaceae bacterium]
MPLRTHPLKTMTLTVCAAALTACSDTVEDTRPGQPVKHRQEAFKDILRVFEPMGTMLRTNSYDADRFALMAEALLERRDGPWSFFADDTYYPPTKAREAVWTRPDDFAAHMQAFVDATDALFEAAQTRELARVTSAYDNAYGTCRNCHEDFRKR